MHHYGDLHQHMWSDIHVPVIAMAVGMRACPLSDIHSYAQDDLWWSLFVHCPYLHPSVNIFKRLLLWSRWAIVAQIWYGAFIGWGNERVLKWSRFTDQAGRHAHIPMYWFILHPGQFGPRGWSCLWVACPPGVKIPRGILPPTLGSLPPGGEDNLAWAACPPPQENLTELNAENFFFFF